MTSTKSCQRSHPSSEEKKSVANVGKEQLKETF